VMWAFLRLVIFVFCNPFVTQKLFLANKSDSKFKKMAYDFSLI
jgi:hypothetical protein